MSTKNIRGPGRPTVDSELLRFRAEREVVDGLDAFSASQEDTPSRPETLRRIVREWLASHGLIAK